MIAYLDNAATTKADSRVIEAMLRFMDATYGNPSSSYAMGHEARDELERSRASIAERIGAAPHELIFTSGGTESNNLALKGTALLHKRGHIITTKVEHESILAPCRWLEKHGFEITYLPVQKDGTIDMERLAPAFRKDTVLVSVIHANNEIGSIQPIEEIGRLCRSKGVLFHSDACQSFTKIPIDVKYIDLLSINGHKMHGPKGVGALYHRNRLDPLIHGGGQELGFRSGTESIASIAGFAKAASLPPEQDKIAKLRDHLIKRIEDEIVGSLLAGPRDNRLCSNAAFIFRGHEAESIVHRLDREGVYVSSGSACSSRRIEPSHVLLACGYSKKDAMSLVRFSLSRFSTQKEVNFTIEALKRVLAK